MNNSLIEDIDYILESKYVVLTALFHVKRGNCCSNSCRNCPYIKNINGGSIRGIKELQEEYKYMGQNFEK
jgi:hypothetical protein